MSDDAVPPPASIRRNAILAFGAEVSSGVFTAGITLYLVHKLGPASFGIYSLALSVGALVILPADFGLASSAARFLAERRGSGAAMAHVLGNALRVKLIASAVVAVVLLLLAGPIASAYGLPALLWPLRAMAVAIFAQSAFGLCRSSFEAMGRMDVDWILIGGEGSVEAVASIALVALGGGAAGAMWGRAIGYSAALALGLGLSVRLLGFRTLRAGKTDWTLVRRLTSYGSALLIVDGAYAAFSQVDVLLVGAMLGADAAGLFAAPLRIVTLLAYPAAAITAGVAPRMAAAGADRPAVAPLEAGLSLLLVLGLLAIVPLLAWAGPLVDLVLGSGYGEAADVLRALAPFILLTGPARLLTTSVNYLGDARRRIVVALAALGLNVVLDLILIPRIGIVGAAVGNDVAFALYTLGHLRICRHLTGLSLMPIARSFGRGLLAAAAMAAVLLAIGRGDHVGVPLLVVGLMAAAAAFFAVLMALREPLIAELAAGVPRLRNRFPRA